MTAGHQNPSKEAGLFPFPALLADIGGTNARFAMLSSPDASLSPVIRLETKASQSFVEAAHRAIAVGPFRRRAVCSWAPPGLWSASGWN